MDSKTFGYYDGIIIRPGKRRMEIKDISSSGHFDRGARTRKILWDAEKRKSYPLKPIYKKVGNEWITQGNYKANIDGTEFRIYPKENSVTFYGVENK